MIIKNQTQLLNSGAQGEASARAAGQVITFSRVSVGDANGVLPPFDLTRTALDNNVTDGAILSHVVDPDNADQRILTLRIAPDADYEARELLIYATANGVEFPHSYLRLGSPYPIRTPANDGIQVTIETYIKVSSETEFSIVVKPGTDFITRGEFDPHTHSAADTGALPVDGKAADSQLLDGYDNGAFGKLVNTQTWLGNNTFDGDVILSTARYVETQNQKQVFINRTNEEDRWYKVVSFTNTARCVRIHGNISNHVMANGVQKIDVTLYSRANSGRFAAVNGGFINATAGKNAGILIVKETSGIGTYDTYAVYIAATKYTQTQLTFDIPYSGYGDQWLDDYVADSVIVKPTGLSTLFDSTAHGAGEFDVFQSIVSARYNERNKPTAADVNAVPTSDMVNLARKAFSTVFNNTIVDGWSKVASTTLYGQYKDTNMTLNIMSQGDGSGETFYEILEVGVKQQDPLNNEPLVHLVQSRFGKSVFHFGYVTTVTATESTVDIYVKLEGLYRQCVGWLSVEAGTIPPTFYSNQPILAAGPAGIVLATKQQMYSPHNKPLPAEIGALEGSWRALNAPTSSTDLWCKIATFDNSGANRRGTIFVSGAAGYSDDADTAAAGMTIYITDGNNSGLDKIDIQAFATQTSQDVAREIQTVDNGATTDLYIKVGAYAALECLYFGDKPMLVTRHKDVLETPVGGNIKPIFKMYHEGYETTPAKIGADTSAEVQSKIDTAIANILNAPPSTLDTLNELAAALGDDPNFATTMTNLISTKMPFANAGTNGVQASWDNGDAVMTIHDGGGNWNMLYGIDGTDSFVNNVIKETGNDSAVRHTVNIDNTSAIVSWKLYQQGAQYSPLAGAREFLLDYNAQAPYWRGQMLYGPLNETTPAKIGADTSAEVQAKIDAAVTAIMNAPPATLDTLNELAAALGDDPNFATTMTNLIGTKLGKTARADDTDKVRGIYGDCALGLNYGSTTQDPNDATVPVILAIHANCPDGFYYHITTTFYATRSSTANRGQIAVRYSGFAATFSRSCYNGVWSAWRQLDLGDTWRDISDSVASASTSVSASSLAVKTAHDKAVAAYNKAFATNAFDQSSAGGYSWRDEKTGFTIKMGSFYVNGNITSTVTFTDSFTSIYSATCIGSSSSVAEGSVGAVSQYLPGSINITNHAGGQAIRWMAMGYTA